MELASHVETGEHHNTISANYDNVVRVLLLDIAKTYMDLVKVEYRLIFTTVVAP